MTTLVGNQIDSARLLVLRQALKLEIRGITRRGPSAYSVLKKMGFSGTRPSILQQLDALRDEIVGAIDTTQQLDAFKQRMAEQGEAEYERN